MTTHTMLRFTATCPDCGFTSADVGLLNGHSCNVQNNGGQCEDFPCCGHERGDCNGLLYGSSEAIRESVEKHYGCDHEAGWFPCADQDYDEDYDDE